MQDSTDYKGQNPKQWEVELHSGRPEKHRRNKKGDKGQRRLPKPYTLNPKTLIPKHFPASLNSVERKTLQSSCLGWGKTAVKTHVDLWLRVLD